MRYLLLIHSPESAWTPEERERCMQTSSAVARELAEQGKLLYSSPLHPVATGKTVRIRDGRTMVTTGPFAETTEQLGGFYLLDVATREEAVAVAERLPPAKKGTVEIRPVMDLEGRPTEKLARGAEGLAENLKLFMLLCYDDENRWLQLGEEALQTAMKEAVGLTHRLAEEGRYLSAAPLEDASTATCVRIRNDKRLVTDGPYAETHEVLGGYYLFLAKDLDEAVGIGARHPGARVGSTEIRQVLELAK